jgi:hypothetical protein
MARFARFHYPICPIPLPDYPITQLPDSNESKLMTISRIVGCLVLLVVGVAGVASGAGRSDIADAVMKGDKAAVRALLQQKQDVNAPQADGATALHWAVYRDDVETAKTLIGAGAKVDVANREGITPLAMASLYGNPVIIDALLKAGADATRRGPTGETVLMLAARNGNPQAIKRLVASGADVNAKENRRGTTALMWAVDQKHPSAVKMLASVPTLVREHTESIAALARAYYHVGETEKARAWLRVLQNPPAGIQAVFLGSQIADEMPDYPVC